MSEPIKLKAEGDKHTMDVASCKELPFGKYKEYEFVGRDGSVVRVPKAATERQFMRIGLNDITVVGRRVTLKRDPSGDPAKPYWGIYLEDGGNGSGPASAGKAAVPTSGGGVATSIPQQPPTQPEPKEKDSALYLRMTQFVMSDVKPIYEKAGLPLTAEAAAAITATLYIQAKR